MSAELQTNHHDAQTENSLGLSTDDSKLVRLYPQHEHESYLQKPLHFRRVWEHFRDYCQQEILFALEDATLSDILRVIPIGISYKEKIASEGNRFKREELLSIELRLLIAKNGTKKSHSFQASL